MYNDSLENYIKHAEPDKADKGYAWHTAIGLQAVDGIKTSKYLTQTAIRNIEGEIDFDEAGKLLDSYYRELPNHTKCDRTEEADKVSVRIAQILSEKGFRFTADEYINIHKRLFTGIYDFAGQPRSYNISKREWVLDGESVTYGNAFELKAALEYDIDQERSFRYNNLSQQQIISHLAVFISRLWQIHAFGEGNTRTTAVFFIKYLRYLGYNVNNDSFANNAWYFRNALVRANYYNIMQGIADTTEYLELFLKNLLLGEHNELHNRTMHIKYQKQDIDVLKQDIDIKKQDIDALSHHLQLQVSILRKAFADNSVFGRSDVMAVLSVSASAASAILKKLLAAKVIATVTGRGKGRYIFR